MIEIIDKDFIVDVDAADDIFNALVHMAKIYALEKYNTALTAAQLNNILDKFSKNLVSIEFCVDEALKGENND